MPVPNGCTMTNGAFSTGFSRGFNVVVLVCGPYYRDAQDLMTPGVQASDLPPAIAAAQIYSNVAAEDERA